MAEHREGFADDVGGKLLLIAGLVAIFGVLALILMPLGAAFAPPANPPAVTAAATPADASAAATAQAPPAEAAQPPAAGTTMSSEAAAPASEGAAAPAAPEGPPPFIAAFFPGIIMLVVALVLSGIAGLFLGYATARHEEEDASHAATLPH